MPKKNMKIFTVLFILGLLIEGFAFLLGQIDYIPFLQKIVSPKYAHSLQGLQKLEKTMLLEPSDEGFTEFQDIFIEILKPQNPNNNLDSISVLKFQREGARMTFSTKRTKEVIPIKVTISNG